MSRYRITIPHKNEV